MTCGCLQPGATPANQNPEMAYAIVDTQGTMRLAQLALEAQRATVEPLEISGFWFKTKRSTRAQGQVFTHLTGTISPAVAHYYTECRVRLTSPHAGQFAFIWQNAIEPDISENPGIPFTVVADEEVREYTIALRGKSAAAWTGSITQVGITGPGKGFKVESITLANAVSHAPDRITLGNVTMETMMPNPMRWTVTVEPGAQFETHVALLDPPSVQPNGAVFRVLAQETGKPAVTLLEKEIDTLSREKWHALHAPLQPYEGTTIDLLFELDPMQSARGDYALWGNPTISGKTKQPRTPIILISCDTMRADHLSCYGYARETSPNLDAFAKKAVLFENAITPETWTLTAHTTMLTGLYPTRHRVNASTNLAESVQTLPETLLDAGYRTAAFTGYRLWMMPTSGLAHGFEKYATPPLVRDMIETRVLVDSWLDARNTEPFFLFFHNYDLHSKFGKAQCENCTLPYYPPPNAPLHFASNFQEPAGLRERSSPSPTDILIAACGNPGVLSPHDLEYIVALYDDAIRGVDDGLAQFFAKLKTMGIYDQAMIVVTSDHGEQFGEHGQFVHEHVYEGSAKVPLLIKFPNGEHGGKRIRDMVQLVDLMPTILEVAGVPAPPGDGQSLIPLIKGEGSPAPWAYIRRQKFIAVRNNDWKYLRSIESGLAELYHLAKDPHETVNIIEQDPEELSVMKSLADAFFQENQQGWHIAFLRPEGEWQGDVFATTSDSFQSAKLLLGGALSYNDLIKWDEQTAKVRLGLLAREEIVLRTNDPKALISLRINGARQFDVVLGDGDVVKGKKFSAELDPDSSPAKPVLPEEVERPTFFIWNEDAPDSGTQAPALTPQEIEELKALGYGGDINAAPQPAKKKNR